MTNGVDAASLGFRATEAGTWVEVDVTSLVTASGQLNLAFTTSSLTAMKLASRQSGANAPQLIIATN